MPVNVELLQKVREQIATEPRRLDMESWGKRVNTDKSDNRLPPCGTVACLAGWTILANTPEAEWPKMFASGFLIEHFEWNDDEITQRAADLLGLEAEQCPFFEFGWGAPEVLAWIDRQIDAAQSK